MPRKIIGTQKSKKGPLYQPGPLNRDPIQHLYKAQEYTMSKQYYSPITNIFFLNFPFFSHIQCTCRGNLLFLLNLCNSGLKFASCEPFINLSNIHIYAFQKVQIISSAGHQNRQHLHKFIKAA